MKVVSVGHGTKAINTAFGACPAVPHGPLSCSECPGSQMMLHRCSYFEKTCFLWLCPHPCLSCGAIGLMVSSPRPQDVPTVCAPHLRLLCPTCPLLPADVGASARLLSARERGGSACWHSRPDGVSSLAFHQNLTEKWSDLLESPWKPGFPSGLAVSSCALHVLMGPLLEGSVGQPHRCQKAFVPVVVVAQRRDDQGEVARSSCSRWPSLAASRSWRCAQPAGPHTPAEAWGKCGNGAQIGSLLPEAGGVGSVPGDPEKIRGLPGCLAHAGQTSVCQEAAEGLLQEGIVTGQLCGGESLCPGLCIQPATPSKHQAGQVSRCGTPPPKSQSSR